MIFYEKYDFDSKIMIFHWKSRFSMRNHSLSMETDDYWLKVYEFSWQIVTFPWKSMILPSTTIVFVNLFRNVSVWKEWFIRRVLELAPEPPKNAPSAAQGPSSALQEHLRAPQKSETAPQEYPTALKVFSKLLLTKSD